VEWEAINAVLLEQFLACPRQAPREVVLDFDTSEDPTHGQQEFAYFNTHYGSYCFLPPFAFARVSGESEEHLVSAELPDTHQLAANRKGASKTRCATMTRSASAELTSGVDGNCRGVLLFAVLAGS
jgi:hypothetical protein